MNRENSIHWRWTSVQQNYFDENNVLHFYWKTTIELQKWRKLLNPIFLLPSISLILRLESTTLSTEHRAYTRRWMCCSCFDFILFTFFFIFYSFNFAEVITTRSIHVTIVSFISKEIAFSVLLVPLSRE